MDWTSFWWGMTTAAVTIRITDMLFKRFVKWLREDNNGD
ncbi:hypothetical protein LCGC14_1438800 [marine sediment metagenome]|uniref:Uncharacterized protein n=1 Tax=marine sediment metagenome TaxID=412755 RepID=A0A0F9MN63_9ZZZZ